MCRTKRQRGFSSSPAAAPTKRCAMHPVFELVSVQVNNRQEFFNDDNIRVLDPEWEQDHTRLKAACIPMRTTLNVNVTLTHDPDTTTSTAPVRLKFKLNINRTSTDVESVPLTLTANGGSLVFTIDTGVVVSPNINSTSIRLSGFSLEATDSSRLKASRLVALTIYTVLGNALHDNVRDSTLLDPGVVPGDDQVARLTPFFSLAHVKQACTWAKGACRLGTHDETDDIVLKTIRSIPEITYGEGAEYYEINDGWNVWDNEPGIKQTGDCSQQASFFVDVLGVLGVRAHDLELKCEYERTDKLYRRYFGEPDPDNWPTHGVVLVRYAGNQYRCYDTTFSDPRKNVSLDEALDVSSTGAFIDKWEKWYWIKTPSDIQDASKALQTQLTLAFDTAAWQTNMKRQAELRFPLMEVQNDPGP